MLAYEGFTKNEGSFFVPRSYTGACSGLLALPYICWRALVYGRDDRPRKQCVIGALDSMLVWGRVLVAYYLNRLALHECFHIWVIVLLNIIQFFDLSEYAIQTRTAEQTVLTIPNKDYKTHSPDNIPRSNQTKPPPPSRVVGKFQFVDIRV